MGIAALADLCSGLLRAGMDPDIPAAVLEKGTTKEQRRIAATVGTLETACKEACVQTPAILIVGRVCELADTFSWFETAEKEQ